MHAVSSIELLKPHVHAGTTYPPGAVLTLEDDLAHWLIDTGVARAALVRQRPKPLPQLEEPSE